MGVRKPQSLTLQNSKIIDQENKNSAKKNFDLPEQNSALPKMYNDGQESLSHGNDSNKSFNSDKKISKVSKINNVSMNQIMINNENSSKRQYMESFGVME